MAKEVKEKKPAKGKKPGERRYRDSTTGEYVTPEYAAAHPETTQSEFVQAWETGGCIKLAKQ